MKTSIPTIPAILAILAILAIPASAQTIAITGGTVYTMTDGPISNGTVVITDGVISAVGANVTVPADATRIDATGKWVTPGLINPATSMGLTEIGAVQETREESNSTSAITPSFNVLEGINPASQLIPVTRSEGVTTVQSRPSGGLMPGQSVVIDPAGRTIEEMVVESPAALLINISSTGAAGGSRAAVLAILRNLFDDALEYDRRRADYDRGNMRELAAPAADLRALLPALRGELTVQIGANRRSDIANALRLAAEYDLKIVITGGTEAWQVADQLRAANVPVILNPTTNGPRYSGLSPRLDNAAILARAGVTVAVSTFDSHNARNVRQMAGNAVAHGLSRANALRAVTINAARALGIDDRYGTLENGRVGNVVVWSGDPLELSTVAEHVMIRGVEIDLNNRQRELARRYRTLPPEY